MKVFFIPYVLACGDSFSAHIFKVEKCNEIREAIEIAIDKLKDEADVEYVFTDEHEIYNEEDYVLINCDGIFLHEILDGEIFCDNVKF